jgi:hypothetical protein
MTKARPSWFPDWTGQRAVIVASGPSADHVRLTDARGRARFIVVNNSWKLAPWADALYGSDAAWWATGQADHYEGESGDYGEFAGLKISRSDAPGTYHVSLKPGTHGQTWLDRLVFDEPGVIGAGGSSGFQALNLAIQFGSRDIALVGFDARVDQGTHWHGDHPSPLLNPSALTAQIWAKHLDAAAPTLLAREIRVVNLSPVSKLTAFPKMDLATWLTLPNAGALNSGNTNAPTS